MKTPLKLHQPHSYSNADHAAKIGRSAAFREEAIKLGVREEDFIITVAAEVKRLTTEQRAQELADYEQIMGVRALTAAIERVQAEQAEQAAKQL